MRAAAFARVIAYRTNDLVRNQTRTVTGTTSPPKVFAIIGPQDEGEAGASAIPQPISGKDECVDRLGACASHDSDRDAWVACAWTPLSNGVLCRTPMGTSRRCLPTSSCCVARATSRISPPIAALLTRWSDDATSGAASASRSSAPPSQAAA